MQQVRKDKCPAGQEVSGGTGKGRVLGIVRESAGLQPELLTDGRELAQRFTEIQQELPK